jgi:hypothetical protein
MSRVVFAHIHPPPPIIPMSSAQVFGRLALIAVSIEPVVVVQEASDIMPLPQRNALQGRRIFSLCLALDRFTLGRRLGSQCPRFSFSLFAQVLIKMFEIPVGLEHFGIASVLLRELPEQTRGGNLQ